MLEKFNYKPPADNTSYGLLAYLMGDGHAPAEKAARHLISVDPSIDVLNDFFMFMTSNF